MALVLVGTFLIGGIRMILAGSYPTVVARGRAWLVVLAAVDALLNSFIFLPAIFVAGILALTRPKGEERDTALDLTGPAGRGWNTGA